MKTKNILLLHNHYLLSGGEDTVVNNELVSLRNAGYQVYYLSFKNKNYQPYHPLTYLYAINSVFNIFSFFKVVYTLITKKIKVMHVHNLYYNASPSVFWAAKLVGVRTIMTIHNYRFFCLNATFFRNGKPCFECQNAKSFYPGLKYKCFKHSLPASLLLALTINFNKWIRTWFTMVDKYIVVNLFTKELLIQSGIQQHKIFYKANYLNITNIATSTSKDYYLFAGRLSIEKGVEHVVETFKNNNQKLVLAGDGELRASIQSTKTNNIELVGFKKKEAILGLMSNAKALIFSSIWIECMPMTIIEALSIGTIPIIAYSINTEKMVDDKINAILYDPNEIDGLKKALIYFEGLTDQERLNMSAAGIQKYHAMYTEKSHMDKIIEIYFN